MTNQGKQNSWYWIWEKNKLFLNLRTSSRQQWLEQAKHNKPFLDSEFVNLCIVAVLGAVSLENETAYENISLCNCMVCGKNEQQFVSTVKWYNSDVHYFSTASDDSTDASNTAQLLICIWGVNYKFDAITNLTCYGSYERQIN
jgi:hypothetical protein